MGPCSFGCCFACSKFLWFVTVGSHSLYIDILIVCPVAILWLRHIKYPEICAFWRKMAICGLCVALHGVWLSLP